MSSSAIPEQSTSMSEVSKHEKTAPKSTSKPCDWCGKPSRTKCSKCEHAMLCSVACMKKLWRTHKYICGRIKPWVVDPRVSPLYAMGELAWDVFFEFSN